MTVDEYSRRKDYLNTLNGHALITYAEMTAFFNLLQRRQMESQGKRRLYCSFFDGSELTK